MIGRRFTVALVACLVAAPAWLAAAGAGAADPFVVVVMDPLSKPLSCDCVKGYAQREYKILGKQLETALGRQVKVVWFESLAEALKETAGKADLVVGKHSVVLADATSTEHALQPLARLTDKEGEVTQKGLIVVRRDDPAKSLASLKDYRVFFGPVEAEEKSSAPERALKHAGVSLKGGRRERFGACSEAASALLELPESVKAAAVISSYAAPLLEGCETIKKGDLRVVGESEPVPFITAFVDQRMAAADRQRLQLALIEAGTDPEFLIGMETLAGFLPWEPISEGGKKKAATLTP